MRTGLASCLSILLCLCATFVMTSCGGDSNFQAMEIPTETKISKTFDGKLPKALIGRGGNIFYDKGCTRCHATKGDKKIVGPSLWNARHRLGVAAMETWIRYPDRMSERSAMPRWDGNDADLIALIAYLRSLSEDEAPEFSNVGKAPFQAAKIIEDTPLARRLKNGVPKDFVADGARLFELKGCHKCHKRKGKIKMIGPVMAGLKDRLSSGAIEAWIRFPGRLKEGTIMPPWDGDDEQLIRLIAYLETL